MLDIKALTETAIDGLLGHEIIAGARVPLFDKDGKPLRRSDGTVIVLSYTHAAAYAAHVIAKSGVIDAKTTSDIAHLPLPFCKPAHVMLFSRDGIAIFALRSAKSVYAPGRSLMTAGGFPRLTEDGPENSILCAKRAFKEQAGLALRKIADEIIDLGTITEHPLISYALRTKVGAKISGLMPSVARTYAVKSNRYYCELTTKTKPGDFSGHHLPAPIVTNNKSVGFFCINPHALPLLQNGSIQAQKVHFLPSTAVKLPIAPDSTMKELRDRLTPGALPAEVRNKYELQTGHILSVSVEDFGSQEYLDQAIHGALALGLLSATASRPYPSQFNHGPFPATGSAVTSSNNPGLIEEATAQKPHSNRTSVTNFPKPS